MILRNIKKIREYPCKSVSEYNSRDRSLCLCGYIVPEDKSRAGERIDD
jgi:hypothetical protein